MQLVFLEKGTMRLHRRLGCEGMPDGSDFMPNILIILRQIKHRAEHLYCLTLAAAFEKPPVVR
jgi:hypothetical protein